MSDKRTTYYPAITYTSNWLALSTAQLRYLQGTYVYLWAKYLKNVLKYKYLSIANYEYLSTSTSAHEKYLSTYLSTNVLK